MAAPFIPKVLIYKEFQAPSTAATQPLHACVVGPHAALVRHSEPSERALGALGPYDPDAEEAVRPWPGLEPGATVDLASARLFVDDAELRFFLHPTGGASSVAAVPGRANQVRVSGAGGAGFAANGARPRLAALRGRDVRRGDRARVSAVVSGEDVSLDTYVLGVAGTEDAAVVGAASADPGNKGTQSSGATVTQVAGDVNCLSIEVDASTYDGLADGAVTGTYTITVLQGSAGNDPTTALLRIRSADGLDDVASVAPAAVDAFKTAGRRGLKFRFVEDEDGPCNLVAGQAWQAVVRQAYAAIVPTSGGSYLGAADDTYLVEVVRGGRLGAADEADRPRWAVSTARGLDLSGAATIAASPSAKPIGVQGVTLSLGAATSVARGERFYVPVTAARVGVMDRLDLAHSLPDGLREAPEVALELYARKDVEVPRGRVGHDPIVNFDARPEGLVVASAITVRDPEFVDEAGAPVDLPVAGGRAFAQYRAFLPGLLDVGSASDIAGLDAAIPGPIHPDNPLKYAASRAMAGANGVAVRFVSVPDPADQAGWVAAIGRLVGLKDVYNIVPLTHDPGVLDLFRAHVAAMSDEERGVDQALVVGLEVPPAVAVAADSSADPEWPILATIADDPQAVGTQNTLVTAPGADALFLTRGVRPGDQVRYAYSTSFGAASWRTGVVARVVSEDSLLLRSGPDAPVTQPSRLEVWRPTSHADAVAALKARAAAYSDARVVAVWTDLHDLAAPAVPSYHLAAAVAGAASGSPPHAALTNVELAGFPGDAAPRGFLTEDQLADLCGNGVWVVSRTPEVRSNAIVTRLGTTTDPSTVATREEMIRRNVDSMTRFVRARLAPYLGTTNVTDSAASLLRVEVDAAHKFLIGLGWTERLGGQLIAADLAAVRQHELFRDRFVVDATWTVPAPTNTIQFNLTLVV